MILGFSTLLNGKPTYFVERIHSGLIQNELMQGFDIGYNHDFDIDVLSSCEPKLHSIREDKDNRWKTGTMIDFFINVRKKNMFRFAPVLPVVSIQRIQITYDEVRTGILSLDVCVIVDNTILTHQDDYLKLAQNDGFDTIEDFFTYFDKDFTGKLIHWTDLKY